MNCIKDGLKLKSSKTSGHPSMRCQKCDGVWLTSETMHAIEDTVFDGRLEKGQMQYGTHLTDHSCPHCGEFMNRFRYRGHNLEIESCPNDVGFWLDNGEDRKIKEVMKERTKGLKRSIGAQQQWHALRRSNHRSSFIERLKKILGWH